MSGSGKEKVVNSYKSDMQPVIICHVK